KSGLFMMVGDVDHLAGTRDLARIPKLMRTAPAAFAVMIIGCASMAGIPPLLGFVAKEFLVTALGGAPGGDWTGWVALLDAAGAPFSPSPAARRRCGAASSTARSPNRAASTTDRRSCSSPLRCRSWPRCR